MDRLFICFETVSSSREVDPDHEQEAVEPLFLALVECLKRRGVRLLDQPSEWDAYGWYVDVAVQDAKLTCMMQRSNNWLLEVFANRTLLDRLKGRRHEAELKSFALAVSGAVQETFGGPQPVVQTEAEFHGR